MSALFFTGHYFIREFYEIYKIKSIQLLFYYFYKTTDFMEFKIDTKESFSVITPSTDTISAKLADALKLECEYLRQIGSKNYIIDLQNIESLEENALNQIVALHEFIYGLEESLVFTNMNENILRDLRKQEADLMLNLAPKMAEAIDIISMEILERDLLSEE